MYSKHVIQPKEAAPLTERDNRLTHYFGVWNYF